MSAERVEFYKPEILVGEVKKHLNKLDRSHKPDYLTFVPNGEPTLDINLGKTIVSIKELGFPVAVITNSSLIDNQQVQEDLMKADWVSLKVDAVSPEIWKKINRPVRQIDHQKILEGMKSFASSYGGDLNTETMLIEGYNDTSEELKRIAGFISLLKPKTAYLSVPTRPPAWKDVRPGSEQKIAEAWQIFQHEGIAAETLTGFEGTDAGYTGNAYEDILNISAVHPLREDTLDELLKHDKSDIAVVRSLVAQNLLREVKHDGKRYYLRKYHV